jgi:hypothetical protein
MAEPDRHHGANSNETTNNATMSRRALERGSRCGRVPGQFQRDGERQDDVCQAPVMRVTSRSETEPYR